MDGCRRAIPKPPTHEVKLIQRLKSSCGEGTGNSVPARGREERLGRGPRSHNIPAKKMKTPHEMLLDGDVARMRREEKEKRWRTALAGCRTPIWPGFAGVIAWPAVLVAILALGKGATVRPFPPFYGVAVLFFVIAVGQVIGACRRRQRAWRALIAEEAPGLYEKLKQENMG